MSDKTITVELPVNEARALVRASELLGLVFKRRRDPNALLPLDAAVMRLQTALVIEREPV